jgi:hypothetical protein
MAIMALTAAYISIAGTTYHDRGFKAEINVDVDEKEVTTFASLGWKEVIGGLKSGSLGLSFRNDHADDNIDEDMWLILGTVVAFAVRHTQSAISTSNPEYQGNVLIKEWKPINGSVGETNELDVSWPTSGAITRDTTP